MSRKEKILLISKVHSSFVKEDIKILSESYSVVFYHFKPGKRKINTIFQLIRLCVYLLLRLNQFHIFVSWFADFYSVPCFIAGKICKRHNVVVVGGYDAVSIPEIKFGTFYKNNFQTKAIKQTYRLANYILPVDSSLIKGTNTYVNPKGQLIGIKNFMSHLKSEFITVPTGYCPQKWKKDTSVERKSGIVTIGGCSDLTTFKRKGLDFFIEIANQMHEVQFTVVGLSGEPYDLARSISADNIKILEYVSQEKLIKILSANTVFAQLSLSEGLPNTLCEAMMCECIPIGSNVNGIPLAIGTTGYILNTPDIPLAINMFTEALNCPPSKGVQARERIIKLFPKDRRKKQLLELFASFK